jgi:hypothetical protein
MSVTDTATWLNALVGISKREYKQGTISRMCLRREFGPIWLYIKKGCNLTCLIVATCIGPYQHTYETIWCILDASLWKVKHTSVGQFVQLPMRKSAYGLRSKFSLFDSQPACAIGLPSPILPDQ